MMKFVSKRMPIMIWPADWCYLCQDPDHSKLESCTILTQRITDQQQIIVEPCGCTNSVVFGEQGKYLIAVTNLQFE